ncbi:MAG: glucose-6-phosphate isomerase [Bacteroidetes bacterium]|nr:glucose-6-phosphate isomerase [Bacteroidota bacterium]
MIRFDFTGTDPFLDKSQWDGVVRRAQAAHRAVLSGTGPGNEWLGWRRILQQPNDALLEDISAVGKEISERADVLLCIGIGGSFLGSEAIIRALSPYFRSNSSKEGVETKALEVIYAGHHLSSTYLSELLAYLEGKSVYVNVISKSGTTLEPAVAFRIIRSWMEDRFDDCERRIIATTDQSKGALRQLSEKMGYRTYIIPDDVGGRFSVLTPVGLLPIAAAGFDIRSLFYGAVAMMAELAETEGNPAIEYALRRYALHERGFTTEVLSVFEPRLAGVGAWWQQLFGESEGKEGKGLFPAVCTFSTDLHSLGQYLQAGRRNLLETFLVAEKERSTLLIPADPANLDGLNYLSGSTLSRINQAAFEGTSKAHLQGGVPIQQITLSMVNEEALGRLIYFFEHAVSVGGYLLGVNPFDQPGVEAYKMEMFGLLGKS